MVDVMAMIELLGKEYTVEKDKLEVLFMAKIDEVELLIKDQPNSESQS